MLLRAPFRAPRDSASQPLRASRASRSAGGFAIGDLGGVFVAQLVDANCSRAAISAARSTASSNPGEDAAHLGLAAQALFGIGLRRGAQLVDPEPLADAGQDIGQPPPAP
jgi:hypothetical protein